MLTTKVFCGGRGASGVLAAQRPLLVLGVCFVSSSKFPVSSVHSEYKNVYTALHGSSRSLRTWESIQVFVWWGVGPVHTLTRFSPFCLYSCRLHLLIIYTNPVHTYSRPDRLLVTPILKTKRSETVTSIFTKLRVVRWEVKSVCHTDHTPRNSLRQPLGALASWPGSVWPRPDKSTASATDKTHGTRIKKTNVRIKYVSIMSGARKKKIFVLAKRWKTSGVIRAGRAAFCRDPSHQTGYKTKRTVRTVTGTG